MINSFFVVCCPGVGAPTQEIIKAASNHGFDALLLSVKPDSGVPRDNFRVMHTGLSPNPHRGHGLCWPKQMGSERGCRREQGSQHLIDDQRESTGVQTGEEWVHLHWRST